LEDPLPRHPGLHCHREIVVPLGTQTRGTITNIIMIVISFTLIYIFLTHHM
jgi:hypothetical protein